jgi:hypothetical protein
VTLDAKFTNVVEVEPVPPLAIGKVPVTLDAKFTNVVEVVPVPPEAIGKAVVNARLPAVNADMWLTPSRTLYEFPSQYTSIVFPEGTVTVAPAGLGTVVLFTSVAA